MSEWWQLALQYSGVSAPVAIVAILIWRILRKIRIRSKICGVQIAYGDSMSTSGDSLRSVAIYAEPGSTIYDVKPIHEGDRQLACSCNIARSYTAPILESPRLEEIWVEPDVNNPEVNPPSPRDGSQQQTPSQPLSPSHTQPQQQTPSQPQSPSHTQGASAAVAFTPLHYEMHQIPFRYLHVPSRSILMSRAVKTRPSLQRVRVHRDRFTT